MPACVLRRAKEDVELDEAVHYFPVIEHSLVGEVLGNDYHACISGSGGSSLVVFLMHD